MYNEEIYKDVSWEDIKDFANSRYGLEDYVLELMDIAHGDEAMKSAIDMEVASALYKTDKKSMKDVAGSALLYYDRDFFEDEIVYFISDN